jgi:hypothetical protein
MANPLFGQFGGSQNNPMSQFMGEFKRLQQTVKDPRKAVENLLQSGQMSQQQFNQLSQMANQLMGRK